MSWIRVDRIVEVVPGRSAVGEWHCPLDAFFLPDHFPGLPLVPGVLQIELVAQTGAACVFAARDDVLPALGIVKQARLYRLLKPGATVTITATVDARERFSVVRGRLDEGSERVAVVDLMLTHIPMPPELKPWFDDLLAGYWGATEKR